LKTFIIEVKILPILKLIHQVSILYLLLKIKVQIIAEYTGSFIKLSDISSFIFGVQIKHGNFKVCLANSKNLTILTDHHTNTAHSGSIQSFQILFNSSLI